jgi:alpha-L-fucosidase
MKNKLIKQLSLAVFFTTGLLIAFSCKNAKQPVAGEGPFKPDTASLKQYKFPDWYRDAKFGIWAHWGPQAVPRMGDWYAIKMYQEGSPDYKYHIAHYGHPSKFGYKDIIPLWKAEKWDPEMLMSLYKKAGAKYFVSMASHHDNYFLWDSKLHKWNSVNMGPKKDMVGLWQKAAKKEGLRFGVSEHLGASYTVFQTNHLADSTGPLKGASYDGNDPAFQDLYHKKLETSETFYGGRRWLSKDPEWHAEWFGYIKELLDKYQPDLLYSDSPFPFDSTGRKLISHYYNMDIAKNNGNLEAVYTCKQLSTGWWVQDFERGVYDTISPLPWQDDSSIGDWYYRTGQKYKGADEIIQILVDVVSKNGNLLMNVVQTPEGDLEPEIIKTLEDIGMWTSANGEGIFGSRPWKVYGEKPKAVKAVSTEHFNERVIKYTSKDIRFTAKGEILFAFCLGKPSEDISIVSLGTKSKYTEKPVKSVTLLGSGDKIGWKQEENALVIRKPASLPTWEVTGFKIEF